MFERKHKAALNRSIAMAVARLGVFLGMAAIQYVAVGDVLKALGESLVVPVPAGWEVQQHKQESDTELIVLGIPLPHEAVRGASANVVVIAQQNRSRISLEDLVASELARSRGSDPQFSLDRLEHESDAWAVALASSRDGSVSYTLYDHYAVTPNTVVSIRIVLPHLGHSADEWAAVTLGQVNEFIQSLAVGATRTGKWELEQTGGEFRLVMPRD